MVTATVVPPIPATLLNSAAQVSILNVCMKVRAGRWSLQELYVEGVRNIKVPVESITMELDLQYVGVGIVPRGSEVP